MAGIKNAPHAFSSDLSLFFLIFSGITRLLLFAFFFLLPLQPPALISFFGCGVYAALLLLRRRRPQLTVVLAQTEISLFSLTMTALTGWDSGFYLYLFGMLAGIFFISGRPSPRFFLLQGGGIITLLLMLLLSPFFPTHFNGLDAAMDGLYFPLFSCNLLLAVGIVTSTAFFFYRQFEQWSDQLLQSNKQLEYLATHDALTGLQNRWSMNELLQLCRAQAERSDVPFTVAIGDIDDFKSFNDSYGHNYGDQVLTGLAETVRSATREGDFVCRWGGEEILILFSATHQDGAKAVLFRVRERLRHLGDGQDVILAAPVTMTFGLCEYRRGQTIEQLIQCADERLYHGKANGKNCIVE